MKITLPFHNRFKNAMLKGDKTWTSRTKRYGRSGDTFEVFDNEFMIEKVERRMLEDVADHWKEEGFASKLDFMNFWIKIHARKGFLSTQRVYVHIFRRISI